MPNWSRAKIERTIRKLIVSVACSFAVAWLVGRSGMIALSREALSGIQGTWIGLMGINFLLEFRARRLGEADPVASEPSQAFALTALIIATGAAGVFAAIKADPESIASLPYIIAVVTVLLAILGFKLASKYKDRIGEARFKAPPEQP